MKTNLKNFPKWDDLATRLDYEKWREDFEAEIRAKKDKEFSLLQFGQLSETSKEIARVLVIRLYLIYREILGEE